MTSDLGADYGEHRRADAQTSCDSAGSSDTGHYGTDPLLMTGNKIRDAALGEPRIRAGEIIGWRIWRLCNGLLQSVIVSYTWHPGVFNRSSSKRVGYYNYNPGYHAFRHKEQAESATRPCTPSGRLSLSDPSPCGAKYIERQHGWRSEYAAVRSIIKINGDIAFRSKQRLLLDLGEKYGCSVVTNFERRQVGMDG